MTTLASSGRSMPALAMAANVILRFPHITNPDTKPRFVPSPALRKLGFARESLRHGEAGAWFTLDEVKTWHAAKMAEVEARQKAAAEGKRLAPVKTAQTTTVGDLAKAFATLPHMNGITVIKGRKKRKPLGADTVRGYKWIAKTIEENFADVWSKPALAVSPAAAKGIIEKIEERHGLRTARLARTFLNRVYKAGNVAQVPWGDVELPVPDVRLRTGEIHEMETFIRAADLMGFPEIGDCFLLGLMTGQRQGDRLSLTGGSSVDGCILLRQSKTGAVVMVPETSMLAQRLAAAKARRKELGKAQKVEWPLLVINEGAWAPWGRDNYRHRVAEIRAAAVAGIKDEEATKAAAAAGRNEPVWKLEPCPSLADFHDQDFRDTSVTWLARAGCTVPEICTITGHSEQSAYQVLKHYLGKHPELARSAIGKLVVWLEAKGAKL